MAKIELYLKPGLEVNAKIMPDPHTHTLMVRGWKTGQYIILDHPVVGANLTKVSPDAKCTLRYVSEGRVTSFASHGITVLRQPVNLFVIDYPKAVHSQISLRKHERLKTTTLALIKDMDAGPGNGEQTKGMILDVSLSGLLVSTNKEFPLNKTLSFDFEFVTGQRVEGVQAKIKNKSIDFKSLDYPYLHGCEFLEIKPQERTIFQNFFEYCFRQMDKLKIQEQALAKAKAVDVER